MIESVRAHTLPILAMVLRDDCEDGARETECPRLLAEICLSRVPLFRLEAHALRSLHSLPRWLEWKTVQLPRGHESGNYGAGRLRRMSRDLNVWFNHHQS
jgi:hypothetical protein